MSTPTSPFSPDGSGSPLPVTGAWRPGDPVGARRFETVVAGRRFQLEGGGSLEHIDVAYESWGTLNDDASNAILVCHALTGDSHAAATPASHTDGTGWWEALVGPGRAIDTDRWFVVCANVLGGCQGTTGPASEDPATGKPYGSSFPIVSIRDMVRVQALLADRIGVRRWHNVIGGSMGGMQALEWATMYPDRVGSLIIASTTTEASALQIAWSHIGRMAVQADPGFAGGDYYDRQAGEGPHRGLAVAREIAQVTYRSDEVFTERFHRTLLNRLDFTLDKVFDVEGYLDYHGLKLVRRFDANSYVRLNRAMDLHDLGRGRGGAASALARVRCPALVAAVRSDGLYPRVQQRSLYDHLVALDADVTWFDIDSPHGHDGFLIETGQLGPPISRFLAPPRDEGRSVVSTDHASDPGPAPAPADSTGPTR